VHLTLMRPHSSQRGGCCATSARRTPKLRHQLLDFPGQSVPSHKDIQFAVTNQLGSLTKPSVSTMPGAESFSSPFRIFQSRVVATKHTRPPRETQSLPTPCWRGKRSTVCEVSSESEVLRCCVHVSRYASPRSPRSQTMRPSEGIEYIRAASRECKRVNSRCQYGLNTTNPNLDRDKAMP